MTNLLIPVGSHFFTPEVLQKAASDALASHPGKDNVLQGTVDANGAAVVLAIGAKDGHAKIFGAFTVDPNGHYGFAAGGSIAW